MLASCLGGGQIPLGSQQGKVGWPFEIKMGPFGEEVMRQSALAALPRPYQENGGKRPERES
jgi:hypothetical protein